MNRFIIIYTYFDGYDDVRCVILINNHGAYKWHQARWWYFEQHIYQNSYFDCHYKFNWKLNHFFFVQPFSWASISTKRKYLLKFWNSHLYILFDVIPGISLHFLLMFFVFLFLHLGWENDLMENQGFASTSLVSCKMIRE